MGSPSATSWGWFSLRGCRPSSLASHRSSGRYPRLFRGQPIGWNPPHHKLLLRSSGWYPRLFRGVGVAKLQKSWEWHFEHGKWDNKVPLRGTSISRCLPPSCEPRWGSCMVLLMIRLFEPFDLFEVMTWSFATPSNPPHHGGQLDFLFLPLLNWISSHKQKS